MRVIARSLLYCLLLGLLLSACASDPPPAEPLPEGATPAEEAAFPATVPPTAPDADPAPAAPVRDPTWPPIFGVETWPGAATRLADEARAANVAWVRYNGINWADVEATRGQRDWHVLATIEADLAALAAEGLTPLVVVRTAPDWALQVPGTSCGAISEAALDDFAAFMGEVVARYGQPPYNIRYWEFGNEPDVDPSLIDPASPFGCWGDIDDPFYGGGYYAEALKRIYPAIKAANPEAQLVVGGLLLDCDPANPREGEECRPARFLEGILQNGGGDAFDIVAYHAYPLWYESTLDADLEQPLWQARGGALLGKLAFLRETMAAYGIDKPIMMDEGGLLCLESYDKCPSPAFYNAQAIHAVRLFSRAWANGLLAAIWYTLDGPGWRESGLLDGEGRPRPAYQATRVMAELLAGATFRRPLGEGALEGYEWADDEAIYQVYWTTDGSTVPLPLPEGTVTLLDKAGEPQQLVPPLAISGEPLWVIIR